MHAETESGAETMKDVIVDTDMLILLSKHKKLDEFVGRYNAHITIITEYEYLRGEIRAGIDADTSKRTLETAFNILRFDNKSVKIAGEIWAKLVACGRPVDERDLIIGAICIANNMPLWTGNKKHFVKLKGFGLRLIEIDIGTWSIKEI